MDDKHDPATTQEMATDGAPRKKGGVMNTLYPPGPKPGAGGRIKNHCRKFWWCDLLVVAVVVLVIVLPIIYVAIPKKAQNDLNKSTLEVLAQEVTNPRANGLELKLVTKARSSSKFHPDIGAFRAALSLENQEPFAHLDIPRVKATAETDIIVTQNLDFESRERFTEYTKTVMASEEFDVYMDGKTEIHLSGLQPIDVDYNKKIRMKGLNHLKGLKIFDIKILSGAKEILPDGSNMIGNVSIPNPSVMTLELGNVTMNLSVDGEAIGTSLLPDMVLKPGENILPMQSTVKQLAVVRMIKQKYHNGIIPLEIKGDSSIYDGEHLPYYEEAIRNNLIKLDLDVGPALEAIGIELDH